MKSENLSRAVELDREINRLLEWIGGYVLHGSPDQHMFPDDMNKRHNEEKVEHLKQQVALLREEVKTL